MGNGPVVRIVQDEVKDKSAAGGMATVYKAIKTGIGGFRSMVALKILHPHLAKDPEYRKMFMEEARVGALLQHRCLLNVLDYGEEEGVAYMVSEYFPSSSLEDLVSRTGPLPIKEALYVLIEAAEGLGALHAARDLSGKRLGLVHRDVSPQNILVGHDGRIKVIDYGIVKRDDPTERTRPGIVKGKCRYMSPEHASAGKVDARSDIYSLGVVFLRALTGARPHGDGNTGEILSRARKGVDCESELRQLKDRDKVVPIARRMLANDPKDRYQSALELAKDARNTLQTEEPSYDLHTFETWMSKNAPQSRSSKGTSPANSAGNSPQQTGRGRRAGHQNREESLGGSNLPPYEKTMHPKWVFMGLAALFIAALVAHLLDLAF